MKKLILTLVVAFIMWPNMSNAQSFDKYANMDGVTSMLITSEMFKLLTEIDYDSTDPETQQYIDLIENLNSIQVYTANTVAISQQMAVDVKAYLAANSLNKLMSFKEDGQSVTFYAKPGKTEAKVSELLMFLQDAEGSQPEAVIMKITGNVDLKQVAKLAKDLDMPGAEELKKIDDK